MQTVTKALLIPLNQFGEILIQDRENYKPPRWGYFGGSVEEGETVLDALIRETQEELAVDISNDEIIELGVFKDQKLDKEINRHAYILIVDKNNWQYKVQEAKGAKWVKPKTMTDLMREFSGIADVAIANKVASYLRANDPVIG